MSRDTLYAKMTVADAANYFNFSLQAVHKKLKTKKLDSYKNQNRVYFGHSTAKKLFEISFKKKIIAFQIVKGGVGKTSIARAFAIRANLYGAKVLCIDLDQQGNLTQAFGVDANETPVMIDLLKKDLNVKEGIVKISPGLDLIPSRIENAILDTFITLGKYALNRVYSEIISSVQDAYDLVIIDCPPALGQSVAAATLAADLVIAPVTPEQFSLSGLKVTFEEISSLSKKQGKSPNLKIILNKFDTRTALSDEVLSTILNHDVYKNMICKTFIRSCQEFPNTLFSGSNVFSTLKNTTAKEDIDLLTREILALQTKTEIDEEVFNEKEKVLSTSFSSENKIPPTKILDKDIIKDVKEVISLESIDKIIRDICGVQKSIFVHMLENIQFRENGYQITNPIATDDLVSSTGSKGDTVRTSIYLLNQKKYIDYYDRKPGRGGYARYRIKEDLSEAFLKHKPTKRGVPPTKIL